jgi:hypothetical protein
MVRRPNSNVAGRRRERRALSGLNGSETRTTWTRSAPSPSIATAVRQTPLTAIEAPCSGAGQWYLYAPIPLYSSMYRRISSRDSFTLRANPIKFSQTLAAVVITSALST